MRVGLVRSVALGMVALVGFGFAACDDSPTDIDRDETVDITTNPSTMALPAGITTLLRSRTVNAGDEPTWEEITATVDGSCGGGAVTVTTAASYEPSIQPPGQFDVMAGTTIGPTCIVLSGGGVTDTVDVRVVGDSLAITDTPASGTVNLFESADLSATLLSDAADPVGPFDPNADLTWASDNTAVMTVDAATGVVSAIGVGSAAITATWTDESGAEVSASVGLATNAPTLNTIAPGTIPPDSLLIDTTVDLDAELIDPTDPPATFGPFDQATDVTWTTVNADGEAVQDNGVVAVDAATGEVTAVGPGTAAVTATWDESVVVDDEGAVVNVPVTGSATFDITVPPPVITTVTPTSGNFGDLITVTGTGFNDVMTVFVDESPIHPQYEPTVATGDPTVTFHVPYTDGTDGDLVVQVGTSGQLSDPFTITREITDTTGEPDNDNPATPTPVALPVDLFGTVDNADLNDFFIISLPAETTLEFRLDWEGPSGDLDLIQDDEGLPFNFPCGFPTASADHPETGTCTLPAGDYIMWVNSFDELLGIYHLEIDVVP